MKFLTETQYKQLLENGTCSRRDRNHLPVVRLFLPDTPATWLLTELDPKLPDMAYGLCGLGFGFPEMGNVTLSELAGLVSSLGEPVVCDLLFTGAHPVHVYAEAARRQGKITISPEHLEEAAGRSKE